MIVPLPPLSDLKASAATSSPDLRAATASVQQETLGISVARGGVLPSVSFDYFYGINANEFATHSSPTPENPSGVNLLGSSAQIQLNVPLWTWGAARSRVKQAELRRQLAQNDLTLTQRQLLSNLNSFHLEAESAKLQIANLRRSTQLSSESLRLTILRYQAGEVSVLEVVDAQSTVVQARNAYDDGMARYRVALANLQTLTGSFN